MSMYACIIIVSSSGRGGWARRMDDWRAAARSVTGGLGPRLRRSSAAARSLGRFAPSIAPLIAPSIAPSITHRHRRPSVLGPPSSIARRRPMSLARSPSLARRRSPTVAAVARAALGRCRRRRPPAVARSLARSPAAARPPSLLLVGFITHIYMHVLIVALYYLVRVVYAYVRSD